jgi:hypothetical protein
MISSTTSSPGGPAHPHAAGVIRAPPVHNSRNRQGSKIVGGTTPFVASTMSRAILLLASLIPLTPSVADAYCGTVTGLAPNIASPSGISLPRDGGIVVGAFSADGPLPKGDPAVQPGWRIKHGEVRTPPRIETLAPGLVVYKSAARTGRIDLEDGTKQMRAWVLATNRTRPVLAAPDVKRAELSIGPGFTSIEVELTSAAPADAIALILTDRQGTARSWWLSRRGSLHQQAFVQNRCEVVPNGSVLSQVGDEIQFVWVDSAGRLSPASSPVALGGKPASP